MTERIALATVVYDQPRRRLAVALFGCLFILPIAAAGAMALGAFGGLLGFAAAVLLVRLFTARYGGTRTAKETALELENGQIRIRALDLSLRKEAVRNGIESVGQNTVVLDLANEKTLHLHLQRDAEDEPGERILTHLGIGPGQRTARVPLRRTLGRFTIGLLTFLGSLYGTAFVAAIARRFVGEVSADAIFWLVLASTLLITALVVRRFGSPHVIVGSDGIGIRGMRKERFIPYAEINAVERSSTSADVVLHLRGGAKLQLPVIAIGSERVSGLVERIEKARRHAGGVNSRVTDALARNGKPLAEWHESLARLATQQSTFREAAVERDEIEGVLVNPNATPEQRLGAAIVLHRIDPEDGGARVRVAAGATADEDLRDALLAVTEDDRRTAG